ncbi:MAG: Fic family protein [Candidatus Omnitrophota bacterium]
MVRKVRKNYEAGLKEQIQQLRERFGNLINVTNAEWYSLFKDEIRNSIAIEGVFANRQDLMDVLENNKRTDKQKAAAILGYFEAASAMYEYANNQLKENEFELRMADIKQIHTLLMRYEKAMGTYNGEIGDFRKTNIQVAQASFEPVDVHYVRPAMQLFIKWFNESLKKRSFDEVILAATTHIWFETIHPFRDGNGRVGRILLSYILIGQGLINVAIKGISKKERDQYYDCLERADDCFENIHKSLEKGKTVNVSDVSKLIKKEEFEPFVEMISGLLKETVNRLKEGRLTNLSQEAVLPLRELARVYDYSQDYLRNLINRGQLKAHKKGKLWYVRVHDLADYINSVSREDTASAP